MYYSNVMWMTYYLSKMSYVDPFLKGFICWKIIVSFLRGTNINKFKTLVFFIIFIYEKFLCYNLSCNFWEIIYIYLIKTYISCFTCLFYESFWDKKEKKKKKKKTSMFPYKQSNTYGWVHNQYIIMFNIYSTKRFCNSINYQINVKEMTFFLNDDQYTNRRIIFE